MQSLQLPSMQCSWDLCSSGCILSRCYKSWSENSDFQDLSVLGENYAFYHFVCHRYNLLSDIPWCLLIVFNCNEKAGNLNIYSFLASTFALKAVSSTDKNPRRQSTRLMTWQNFHFLLSLLKAKRFCWEPRSSSLPQAPPSWYKTTLNLPAGLN